MRKRDLKRGFRYLHSTGEWWLLQPAAQPPCPRRLAELLLDELAPCPAQLAAATGARALRLDSSRRARLGTLAKPPQLEVPVFAHLPVDFTEPARRALLLIYQLYSTPAVRYALRALLGPWRPHLRRVDRAQGWTDQRFLGRGRQVQARLFLRLAGELSLSLEELMALCPGNGESGLGQFRQAWLARSLAQVEQRDWVSALAVSLIVPGRFLPLEGTDPTVLEFVDEARQASDKAWNEAARLFSVGSAAAYRAVFLLGGEASLVVRALELSPGRDLPFAWNLGRRQYRRLLTWYCRLVEAGVPPETLKNLAQRAGHKEAFGLSLLAEIKRPTARLLSVIGELFPSTGLTDELAALPPAEGGLDELVRLREWQGKPPLPARLEPDDGRELVVLRKLVADYPERSELSARLARLEDPTHRWRLARANGRRQAKYLAKALERERRACLELAQERACGRLLTRLKGPQENPRRVARLLGVGLELGPLFERLRNFSNWREQAPKNRAWLEQAAGRGLQVRAWLDGLEERVEISGRAVTLRVENDPWQIVEMGVPFGTCLSLESGSCASSAVLNALEVNKRVVYGLDQQGKIVMRKLLAATNGGGLLGYHTYSHLHGGELVMEEFCRRFAARCGLRLTGRGKPESLETLDCWYDDGEVAWSNQSVRPPTGWPDKSDGRQAWASLCLRSGLTSPGFVPASASDLFWWIRWGLPTSTSMLNSLYPLQTLVALSWEGWFGWLEWPVYHKLSALIEGCRPSLQGMRQLARVLRLSAGGRVGGSWHEHRGNVLVPPALVLLPIEELLDCLQDLLSLASVTVAGVTDLIEVAWLRDGRIYLGGRRWKGRLQPALVRLAQRHRLPELTGPLRRRLRRCREMDELEQTALALGTQSDPRDRHWLENLLERHPTSLTLARAAARCGGSAASYEPPSGLEWSREPDWLNALRELALPRLTRRLVRALRRGQGKPSELLEAVAWLGLVDPRAVAQRYGLTGAVTDKALNLFAWSQGKTPGEPPPGFRDVRLEGSLLAQALAGDGIAFDQWLRLGGGRQGGLGLADVISPERRLQAALASEQIPGGTLAWLPHLADDQLHRLAEGLDIMTGWPWLTSVLERPALREALARRAHHLRLGELMDEAAQWATLRDYLVLERAFGPRLDLRALRESHPLLEQTYRRLIGSPANQS
ncbi:MAG: hypothetical protein AB7S38_33975 [Vulcanimicrobiota bacterium]